MVLDFVLTLKNCVQASYFNFAASKIGSRLPYKNNAMRKFVDTRQLFGQLGHFIYQYPKSVLTFTLIVAVLCCASLYKLRIDTSNESNLDKTHPDVVTYKAFHEKYGFEEALVVMIKTNTLFTEAGLKRLVAFHKALEENTYNLDRIKSLASADVTYGEDDELIVDNLLLSFPESQEDIETFKLRVFDNPLLRDNFLSREGDYTAIYLYQHPDSPTLYKGEKQPFTSMDQHYYVESVREIVAQFEAPDFKVNLSGGPMIGDTLLSKIALETPIFALSSNFVIFLLLYFLFRRATAVILPILIIDISLASTLGVMAFFDVALSSFSQILPAFILTVGVCDSVHFLSIFFQNFNKTHDKQSAVVAALSHTGMPIVLTSLTTMMGMLSFAMADIIPIADLGIFAALGVFIVFFFTLLMLPALMAITPIKPSDNKNQMIEKSQRWLAAVGRLGWTRPKLIVGLFSLALISSVYFVSQLRFQHDPVQWLPEEQELPVSIKMLNEEFYGAIAVELLLDTGIENGIKTVAFQERLDDFNDKALAYELDGVHVDSSRSIVDVIKQVNASLHGNDKTHYKVPETDELVAQELLLFEMSGGKDLQEQITADGSGARITMLAPWRDLIKYSNYLDELDVWVKDYFAEFAEVTMTGVVYLISPVQKMAIEAMADSYVSASAVITFMMILMLGVRLGLLSMVPNLLPIIVGMGAMHVLELPLDLYSILIGSIAIGLVVDDTVHFLNSFKVYYKASGNAQWAIEKTLETTGNALLFTTVLLACGFMTYLFSTLISLQNFGIITTTIVVLALFADILLLPAILRLIYAKEVVHNKKEQLA